MHARTVLIRPADRDRHRALLGDHPAEVIVVDDADAALAGDDGLEQQRIARERLGGEVGDPTAHDLLGLRLAVARDQRGHQRAVVDMLRAAQAELALPRGAGEVRVALHLGREALRRVGLRRVRDRPRAHRESIPTVAGVAQVRRHIRRECGVLERREQPLVGGEPKITGIDGDQKIGGCIRAFGAQPLDQRAGIVRHGADLCACGLRVLGEEVLDQLVLARRVDHDLAAGRGRGSSGVGRGRGRRVGTTTADHQQGDDRRGQETDGLHGTPFSALPDANDSHSS